MLNRLKKTVKHSAVYSLGSISTKLVGLILLPLYTGHLTTSEYGMLSIVEITSQLILGFFTLGLPQAMMRWLADENDEKGKKKLVFTTLTSLTFVSILLVVSILPFNEVFSSLIFGSNKFDIYISLLLIWSIFGIVNRVPYVILRINEQAGKYVFIIITKFTIVLLANIYFVAYASMGIEGIVWGQIIGEIYSLLITLPLLLRNMNFGINAKVLIEMLKYSIPISFSSVSTLLLAFGDRYILTGLLNFSSVGIYSLGQKLGGVINVFLVQSFQLGFIPIAFKMFDQKNSNRFFSKILTYFTLILAFSALGVSLFSEEVVYLFTKPEYFQAYTIVPFIAFAFMIKGMNMVFTLGYHYSKRTGIYAVIIVGGMLLNILLNFLLIPVFGIYGSGLSMITSYTLMAIFSYRYSQNMMPVNFEIIKIVKIIMLSFSLYFINFFLIDFSLFINFAIKMLLLLIFPVILFYLNFFEDIELLRIRQSWHKWKHPSKWKENLRKIRL